MTEVELFAAYGFAGRMPDDADPDAEGGRILRALHDMAVEQSSDADEVVVPHG
jgi:hypothetical protein